jgi:hypothetical protein
MTNFFLIHPYVLKLYCPWLCIIFEKNGCALFVVNAHEGYEFDMHWHRRYQELPEDTGINGYREISVIYRTN